MHGGARASFSFYLIYFSFYYTIVSCTTKSSTFPIVLPQLVVEILSLLPDCYQYSNWSNSNISLAILTIPGEISVPTIIDKSKKPMWLPTRFLVFTHWFYSSPSVQQMLFLHVLSGCTYFFSTVRLFIEQQVGAPKAVPPEPTVRSSASGKDDCPQLNNSLGP